MGIPVDKIKVIFITLLLARLVQVIIAIIYMHLFEQLIFFCDLMFYCFKGLSY